MARNSKPRGRQGRSIRSTNAGDGGAKEGEPFERGLPMGVRESLTSRMASLAGTRKQGAATPGKSNLGGWLDDLYTVSSRRCTSFKRITYQDVGSEARHVLNHIICFP